MNSQTTTGSTIFFLENMHAACRLHQILSGGAPGTAGGGGIRSGGRLIGLQRPWDGWRGVRQPVVIWLLWLRLLQGLRLQLQLLWLRLQGLRLWGLRLQLLWLLLWLLLLLLGLRMLLLLCSELLQPAEAAWHGDRHEPHVDGDYP